MSLLEQTLSIKSLDSLRERVIQNLKDIELSKHLIRTHDRTKLMNDHNQILMTLDNMINIKKVEMNDPYNKASGAITDPRRSNRTIVYNPDGSTTIKDESKMKQLGEEWESMFDPSLLQNPPCYQMPPQNLTSIQRINRSNTKF
jgi:hypothetical protein